MNNNNEFQEPVRPFCSQNVTHCKAVLSTNILKLIEVAPHDPNQEFGRSGRRIKKKFKNKKTANGRFLTSLTRSRTKVFEHVCNNFSKDSIFITPTYGTPVKIDQYDIALNHFDNFRRKLKKELGEFRYLAIAEIQPISKRIHFHMLVDRKRIEKELLEELWGQGYVKVKEVYGKPQGIAGYITKYMTKETIIPFGRKSYLCSRNLKKSIVVNDLFSAYGFTKDLLEKFKFEKSDPYAFDTYIGRMQITKFYFPEIDLHKIDISQYNNKLTKNICDTLSTLENPQRVKTVKSNQLTIKSTT